jgi:hypothetical protein
VNVVQLRPWKLAFKKGWDKHFKKFDRSVQQRILKKFGHMKQPLQPSGLKASRSVVEEVGQHRIAFFQNEAKCQKEIHFVGNHKQYEKWYRSQ